MIPAHHNESKMVAATQGRIAFVAITKKFDQSELDHRPALASYSPAKIQAAAATQRFGTYGSDNGLVLDVVNVSSLTLNGHHLTKGPNRGHHMSSGLVRLRDLQSVPKM